MLSWPVLLLLLPLVFSSPLERRANTAACGQFDTITSGSYSLLTNHWGVSAATSGWQCSTLESVQSTTVKWSTEWTWAEDETGIKSFSSIQLNAGINRKLGAITSMKSTWKWSQTSSGSEQVVANVAYDLFTSRTAGGSNLNEVMIWLADFNAGPISYEYDYNGQATPIAKSLAIADHKWDLYSGSNGSNKVYSFLPVSGSISSFSGDIYKFFTYLVDKGYITSSEYLVTAQAGTEATCGSAIFKTSAYELTID